MQYGICGLFLILFSLLEMDDPIEIKKIRLQNSLKELSSITHAIDEIVGFWALAPTLSMTLNLLIEEAFTNIVYYAYQDAENHEIELVFEKHQDRLIIRLIDDGKPYDPLQSVYPELDLPVEERKIGGLGIYLMREMTDKLTYQRKDGYNILSMEKAT